MTNLPPERDLPGAARMVDDIISGVDSVKSEPVRKSYIPYLSLAAAVTLVSAMGVVAFQLMGRGTAPVVPGTPTPTAPVTMTSSPSSTTTPSPSATSSPDPSPTTTSSTTTTPERPTGPVTMTAELGETVRTRYFDVTVSALEADDEGLAWGAKVEVCYAAPHSEQNADGTTRTSVDPWYFSVQDGEAGGPAEWVKVKDLPSSTRWSPAYGTKLVKLGECNSGWVQAEPGSPDLFFPDLRYAPANFGDDIRWNWPSSTDPETPDRPTGPVSMTAELGETVQTRYFDVTVLDFDFHEENISWAAEVEVCYAARHPEENADGTTRTSVDPWYFSYEDLEAGRPTEWVKLKKFPQADRWEPVYKTKLLKLGECNTGWLQIETGNPHVAYPSLRYAPGDFGDDIRWKE